MTLTENIAEVSVAEPQASAEPATGSREIEARLGGGALGEVFRARETEPERQEALKLFHPGLSADAIFRDRFYQAVGAAAALYHPNIVEIFDSGEQGGQLFVAMEYLAEGSLRDLLQRRGSEQPLALAAALDIARQAADALVFAHALGVVHRNLKPGNILLKPRDDMNGAGRTYAPKLSDWGLARTSEEVIDQPEQITSDTLAYAAPEWFQGAELDARSDLYSLGIILYESLTGYLPFEARTFNAAWQKHCFAAPTPPGQVRAGIPAEVEAMILRCLAKSPADRFASAAELSSALQKALRSSVVAAPPAPEPPPAISAAAAGEVLLAPRVHVLDGRGQTLMVADLSGEGLTVGSRSDNDIALPSDQIAAQLLQIDWDGRQASVTALDTAGQVLLEGVALAAQAANSWNIGTMLRVEPYWLRLEPGPVQPPITSDLATTDSPALVGDGELPLPASVSPLDEPAAGRVATPVDATGQPEATVSRIGVILDGDALTLTPGRPTPYKCTLANLGAQVDHFTVIAEGIPATWLAGPPQVIQLNPGQQDLVTLNVMVPVAPESRAADYPVTIRARSRENPSESGTASTVWTVLPFAASSLEIRPKRASAWRRAGYSVNLRNLGNAPARYNLAGADEEEALDYRFANDQVELAAGASARVRLAAYPHPLRWFGQSQRHAFTVSARPDREAEIQTVAARLDQRALLPAWFLRIVPAVLLLAAVILYLFGAIRALDPLLKDMPAYAKLRPKPTPAPTAVVAITMPLFNPTPAPTAQPTASPQPTATVPPAPTAVPAPTPIPAPPTATPVPVCMSDTPFTVTGGAAPPRSALLLWFDNRVVSGGSADQAGNYAISLRIGRERSGEHRITVRERGTTNAIQTLTCIVP